MDQTEVTMDGDMKNLFSIINDLIVRLLKPFLCGKGKDDVTPL